MGTKTTTKEENDDAVYDYEDTDKSEIIGNEKSANDGGDSTFEEELADGSSTMYIVIGGMATLFFLHYKRKLPPAFYNIGRGKFKPVLGNEEFPVVDDDEKNHPTIVKNGNGKKHVDSEKADEDDNTANVNGDLTTVTWTANESTNGSNGTSNGTAANGTNEEKEPLKESTEEPKEE